MSNEKNIEKPCEIESHLKHTSEEATQVNIINENNNAKNKNLAIERRDSTKKREDKQCTKSLIL